MKIKDYKIATEKLNQFIHESRMKRSWLYRIQCEFMEKAIRNTQFAAWNTERKYGGLFELMSKPKIPDTRTFKEAAEDWGKMTHNAYMERISKGPVIYVRFGDEDLAHRYYYGTDPINPDNL